MHLSAVTRLRPTTKPDPMNPRRALPDWNSPDELALAGFVDAEASVEQPGVLRSQVTSGATLYLGDVDADVRRGDRITDGARTWVVEGFPVAPMSPFTGWRPWRVVRLKEVVG